MINKIIKKILLKIDYEFWFLFIFFIYLHKEYKKVGIKGLKKEFDTYLRKKGIIEEEEDSFDLISLIIIIILFLLLLTIITLISWNIIKF